MPKQAARRYPYAYLAVFDYVVRAIPLAGEKYRVDSVDAPNGVINVKSSMNLLTWGESITINVRPDVEGWTRVDVAAAMRYQLVDWGQRNRDLVELFGAFDSVLPGGEPVDDESAVTPTTIATQPVAAPTAQLPPAGWHADPHGRHELRYWDGSAWSEHVSNHGATSTDPVG
jgi:Protein of unknown function (DUF2510)